MKKADNNLNVPEVVYIMFWTGVVVAIVTWLWPILAGAVQVAFGLEVLSAMP